MANENPSPRRVVAVVGPTASGKTALGVLLAQAYGGEVISCDSLQIYRRMDIGTAKPTPEEMRGIPHHMIDVADPRENWSVARYAEMAARCVDDVLRRGRLPIIVGGTGLYLDALLSGRTFALPATGWRRRLQNQFIDGGIEPLWAELERVDPEAAGRLHKSDVKRVIRALEVYHETGRTITQHNRESRKIPPRYQAVKFGLSFARREDLWRRIDLRVDEMARRGLKQEVRDLLDSGVPRACTAMQAIGYKELTAALETGGDTAAAFDEIKLRTRQYAKRQLTWFRRDADTNWFLWDAGADGARLRQFVTEKMEESGIQ